MNQVPGCPLETINKNFKAFWEGYFYKYGYKASILGFAFRGYFKFLNIY